MARSKAIAICPPGIWCLSPLTGFLGILGILAFIAFISYMLMSKPITAPLPMEKRRIRLPLIPEPAPPVVVNVSRGGDDRYTRAPEPQRFWNTGPDVRGALIPPGAVPINIATQGFPESYQQMGILKVHDGNSGDKVLPLYGRRLASRSDRYNYYTRTDTYNPIQLPINFQKRDCQDPVGCQEIFDGDDIKIAGTGQNAKATLYRFDGPMYVPSVI